MMLHKAQTSNLSSSRKYTKYIHCTHKLKKIGTLGKYVYTEATAWILSNLEQISTRQHNIANKIEWIRWAI